MFLLQHQREPMRYEHLLEQAERCVLRRQFGEQHQCGPQLQHEQQQVAFRNRQHQFELLPLQNQHLQCRCEYRRNEHPFPFST